MATERMDLSAERKTQKYHSAEPYRQRTTWPMWKLRVSVPECVGTHRSNSEPHRSKQRRQSESANDKQRGESLLDQPEIRSQIDAAAKKDPFNQR